MPDPRDNGSLDTRIRDLVARAVATAPRPPELDPGALPTEVEPDNGHRRWWVGGGAALLAAAATIATLLLVGGADETVRTPATDPTIVVAPVPTAPPSPGSTAVPTSVPPIGTAFVPIEREGPFLTAGPGGVVDHRGRVTRVLTYEPAAIALDTGDDRVILQRQRGEGSWTAADTEPLVISPDGELVPVFDGFDWGGHVVLHDVEVVAGRRLLLYSVLEGAPPRPHTLFVVDLDTAEQEEVGPTDVDPINRLHLATTGLIVGTFQNQLSHGIEIHAVPGSPAAEEGVPTAADLGLEASYLDCRSCPSAFTVTPDGSRVAWIDEGNNLLAVPPAGGTAEPVMGVPGALFADADWDGQRLLLSFTEAHGSVPIDLPAGTPLEGRLATLSPYSPDSAAEPPPTTAPAPGGTEVPVSVPPEVIAQYVLTAGPEGVVEHRDGETRTLTTEPMAIALDAGDGRAIVQRQSGVFGPDQSGAASVPLVLGPDGSLTELFGTADWDEGVVLHDVEVVAGRRLLLFSLQVGMDSPETADEMLWVVDLDSGDRTQVSADPIGGWEFGTDRLHLATTGLIVGEASAESNHSIAVYAVPDSPAAAADLPGAADLGLEESYGDCADCPIGFTVTADGGSIAWADSGGLFEISLERLDAGPTRIADVPDGFFTDVDLGFDALLSRRGLPQPPPLLVPLDGGEPVELEGTSATYSPLGSDASEPPPATTVPADCGVDPGSATITDHVDEVPPLNPSGFPGWTYQGDSNFDPCAALSYAVLETRGGTGSSPVQVMLFHQGEYVGTATECMFAFTSVARTTEDSVTLEYRWPREGDPNAAPSGLAQVRYWWDGDEVAADGELPQELLEISGCTG